MTAKNKSSLKWPLKKDYIFFLFYQINDETKTCFNFKALMLTNAFKLFYPNQFFFALFIFHFSYNK